MQIRMPGRVYVCKADLTVDDVTCWQSTDKDEICLPCRMITPFRGAAMEIISDYEKYHGDKYVKNPESIIDNAKSTLKLLVYCNIIHAACDLTLHLDNLDNGEAITKWIPDIMGPRYSIPILNEFFRRGAAGLTNDKRELWERRYTEFQERHKHWDVWGYTDENHDDEDESIMLPQTEVMPYQPDN